MRLAIVGSRTFKDYELLCKYALYITQKLPCSHIVIISGGARGADSLGEQFARAHRYDTQIFKPEWDKYGKAAGFLRNGTIVANCDIVLAFWDGKSQGTADTIARAKKAKKPTFIIYI